MGLLRTLAIALSLLLAGSANHAEAAFDPVSYATTALAVDAADQFITSQINKARDAADFVLEKALMDARAALQAWRAANSSLLDKAFSELSAAQKQFFANLAVVIDRADRSINGALTEAREISELAYQLSSETLLGKDVHLLIRTSPSRIVPIEGQDVRLRCRTVGLDNWSVSIIVADTELKPVARQLQESTFLIPSNLVAGKSGSLPFTFRAQYERLFWWDDYYETQGIINILPQTIGSFEFEVAHTVKERRTDAKRIAAHDFTGTNEVVQLPVQVQNGGNWQIDTASIRWNKTRGEASDDCHLVSPASHTGVCSGFVIGMYCGRRSWVGGFPPRVDFGPGWGIAEIFWTEFLDEEVTRHTKVMGDISMLEDRILGIPPNSKGFTGVFRTFDGKTIAISGTQRVGPVTFEFDPVTSKIVAKTATFEL